MVCKTSLNCGKQLPKFISRYIYVTTLRVQFKLPEKLEDFSRHAFLETDVLEVCTTSKVKRLKFDATDGNDGATTARYTFSVKSQHS